MRVRTLIVALLGALIVVAASPRHAVAAPAGKAQTYAQFAAGATVQRGIFTILRKQGEVYIDLSPQQLDTDYLETIVPGNGMGGDFIVWGNTDHLPAMLMRFERAGDGIAIVWPNTSFVAPHDPPETIGIRRNFPQSVVGIGKIVAEDPNHIVFDASPLFRDSLDMAHIINGSLGTTAKSAYHLDLSRTYFGMTKAFPENVVIDVNQLWATDAPHVAPDTAPDARSVQMRIVYNFAQLPHDRYRPRYADDRVGIYDDIYMDFAPSRDQAPSRYLRYLVRWNFAPADPNKPSRATHPMVFYLSNTIPVAYRPAITAAVLRWNQAFEKIGILDAIQVKPQPNDPNWDPDDIRYNVLRWVTEQQPSFGADSQTLFDPRTGEEFRTGILISADSARFAAQAWRDYVDPVRYGRDTDPVPAWFIYDSFQAEIMHETGHNLGMQHNFMGSMAYTAKELQSKAFTAKYGIASTVMEYAPLNLWPRPYHQGSYYQTVLGPYDYYAMRYAYANIPGATTPAAELPTLRRWASHWSDPRYRYASDEDVSWRNGHAADPRSEQGDLTSTPLAWSMVQMKMLRWLMIDDTRRLPHVGGAYQRATQAFAGALARYLNDALIATHYVGGQYLSRAHRGDPGAAPPIVPVPLARQARALGIVTRYLFSDRDLTFAPQVLDKLGYSEWAGYGYVGWEGYGNLPIWAYNPPQRHDYPVVEVIAHAQRAAIDQLFEPTVLERIDENHLLATAATLTMPMFYNMLQRAIFREVAARSHHIALLRRNLQIAYTRTLIRIAATNDVAVPADARALAGLALMRLHHALALALRAGGSDDVTLAHYELLNRMVATALKV